MQDTLHVAGEIVYHGPREHVLEFFEEMGFRLPHRKGVADFLQVFQGLSVGAMISGADEDSDTSKHVQEVTSKKDQRQFWKGKPRAYRFVSVPEIAAAFAEFHVGKARAAFLAQPPEKTERGKLTWRQGAQLKIRKPLADLKMALVFLAEQTA